MNWKSNIWNPKELVVVFVQLNKDGNKYSAAIANMKKDIGQITIAEFDSIDVLFKKFGNSRAYWIHVIGSGVLTRLSDRVSGYKDDLIINGDKNDFMFTSYTDGEKSAVSFVRRKAYEHEQETFQTLKAHIVGFSCGPTPIFEILDANEIYKGEFLLSKSNNLIKDCSRREQSDLIDFFRGEKLSELQVVAFAICKGFNQQGTNLEIGLSNELSNEHLEEYREHRKFNVLGVGGILIILLLVVGNYFYINHLNNNIAQLEADLTLSNDNLSLLDRLDQEKSRKEQLIENSGFMGNKYISFFLDKIGVSVPGSIYLKTLYVFPTTEKLKEKRRVLVDSKRIEIEGTTSSNVVLDDWIEKLNRYEWVQSVEVLNYTKVDEQKAQFKLLMILMK